MIRSPGLGRTLLNGMSSRSCFLPGPDFSSSCSTSKTGTRPHSVTSVPWAPPCSEFHLGGGGGTVCPASFPCLAPVHQVFSLGMRWLDSAALIQNQNQVFPLLRNPYWALKHISLA